MIQKVRGMPPAVLLGNPVLETKMDKLVWMHTPTLIDFIKIFFSLLGGCALYLQTCRGRVRHSNRGRTTSDMGQ
jgi:hypothetical protein